MRNFIQPGKVLTMVATAAVTSGSFVKVGAIFGVAATSAAIGEEYELDVSGGVYEMPKVSAQAWTAGAVIYADASGIMTTVDTGNTKVGVAVKAAANPSGAGFVKLNNNF